ncbi:MAG: transposase [Acidobacteria bacterium]|nr:transposase [Acidobacteriota bacterium]
MTAINSAQAVSRDQDGDVQDNIDPAARPTRRTFSTEEKLALLAAYELCDPGKKGEFARREGLYSSQLTEWRRARDAGTLVTRESTASRRDRREFEKLEQRNKRLEAELERTRLALDIVGKAHALLEMLSESADNE